MTEPLPLIFDFTQEDLCALIQELGHPSFHGKQLWQGLYQNLSPDINSYTNISKELKTKLTDKIAFASLSPVQTLFSKDRHTKKVLFQLPDGHHIETVLMTYEERNTLCISTQVGCAVNCSFCATGQMGFKRNLSSGEIVEQVIYFARELKAKAERVTNVVFMGMGEPFLNYDATLKAISLLNHPDGLRLGERRMTISTSGIIPGIRRFTEENSQVNLAVSLHSADDEIRSQLMPINRKYPVDELLAACREYVNQTRRRITFEWALIEGINDTPEAARQLISKIKGMICHVNLILLNPTTAFEGNASTQNRAAAFQSLLEEHGIPCTIRLRRGIDIQAGCGQLASKER
jgi:23S rRNA (adenine2503-C2)-methyltransferase